MLRNGVLVFALLVLVAGLVLLVVQPAQAFGALVFGTLLTLGTAFERWRYKPAVGRGKGQPTGERFADPTTGELMEVWYDAATGERSYIKVEDGKKG